MEIFLFMGHQYSMSFVLIRFWSAVPFRMHLNLSDKILVEKVAYTSIFTVFVCTIPCHKAHIVSINYCICKLDKTWTSEVS